MHHLCSVVPKQLRILILGPSLATNMPAVDWHLPRHAWDCHVHVFDPTNYPYAPSHAYSPVPAPYSTLLAFEGNLSVNAQPQNIVLVQPSPYGTDNSLILDLLEQHSSSNEKQRLMRGISVIDPKNITDAQLERQQQLGIRGIRVNAEATGNVTDYAAVGRQIAASADRVAKYKQWKCQLFIAGDVWDGKSCQYPIFLPFRASRLG